MNILFLSSRIPFPVVDGHTNRTYNTIKELARCGNSIHLLALAQQGDGQDREALRHLKKYCDNIEVVPAPSKKPGPAMIARLLASILLPIPYTICRHYSFAFAKKVSAVIGKTQFDLVHFDVLPVAAYHKAINGKVPTVITDHDVCYVKAQRISDGMRNPAARWFLKYEAVKLRRYEKRMLSIFSMVVSVSQADAMILTSLSPSSAPLIGIAPNGVETTHFACHEVREEEKTILWVGGASYFPNKEAVFFFIRKILPLIRSRMDTCRFLVVGNGFESTQSLLSDADRKGVEFLGFVPDVSTVLSKSQVFVCPLLSGSGTRLKLLEAMAAGKAIVTTAIGCEGIEGMNGSHFLVGNNPEHFAELVLKVLSDADLRGDLGRRARKLATDKYEWSAIISRLNDVYKVLSQRRDGSDSTG